MLLHTFIRTFGIPRAISYMVEEIYDRVPQAETLLWGTDPEQAINLLLEIETKVRDKIWETYGEDFSHWPANVPQPTADRLELLDIKAALCLTQQTDVASEGISYCPADLEECGYLVHWLKISETKKHYTRPFFLLDDILMKPLTVVKNKIGSTEDWKCLEMTLGSLILHPDMAKQLNFDNSMKGSLFEKATAISLYVQQTVQQLETKLSQIELQSILEMDTPVLNIEGIKTAKAAWKGVVQLSRRISDQSADLLNKIHEAQVVTVDVTNSEFANVVVPLTTTDGRQIFLGLQATQYQPMPNPEAIARIALATLENPNFYYATLAPIAVSVVDVKTCMDTLGSAKGLSQADVENRKARLCTIPANAVVSPLYLAFYGFAPVISALNESTPDS